MRFGIVNTSEINDTEKTLIDTTLPLSSAKVAVGVELTRYSQTSKDEQMNAMTDSHEIALSLAKTAMLVDSASGCSLGAWRDGVLEICRRVGIPEPDDVVAWVSGGKASDTDVTDWSRQFSIL